MTAPAPFALTPLDRPICSACKLRPVRLHPVNGWWGTCNPCNDKRVRAHERYLAKNGGRNKLCIFCRKPMPEECYSTMACTLDCANAHNREYMAKKREAVLAALGGKCSCTLEGCPSGHPPTGCPVTATPLLDVEHTKNDGWLIRQRRMNGSPRSRASGVGQPRWSMYQRSLRLPDHGMVLLCANCHRQAEHLKRIERAAGRPS
jgi:hypothetical protein